jgi:hypothetical protein
MGLGGEPSKWDKGSSARLSSWTYAQARATIRMNMAWRGTDGVFVLILAAACGDSSGMNSPPLPAVSAQLQTFAKAYCGLVSSCCQMQTEECALLVEGSALESGYRYDQTAGQTCLAAMAMAQGNACQTVPFALSACSGIFSPPGQTAAGQPCSQNADCSAPDGGTSLCAFVSDPVDGGTTTTGTCSQQLRGSLGQTCSATVTSDGAAGYLVPPQSTQTVCYVTDGLWCPASMQQCIPLGATGQACEVDDDCVAGDYCPMKACAPRIATGGPCDPNANEPGCVTNSNCNPTSGTCVPTLPTGTACTLDAECANWCLNGRCAASANIEFCFP